MEAVQGPAEPRPEHFNNPLPAYLAATRPPFILATVVPVLLGLAMAWQQGYPITASTAILSLLSAVLLHAGINVLSLADAGVR